MKIIRTILHPTDFSVDSEYAFEMACSLAHDHDARLIVLHVMYPSSMPLNVNPAPDPRRSAESQEAVVGRFPWPQPSDPAILIEHRIVEGDPVHEILSLASSLNCDLIVMGTHGRTGLKRLLAGSVADGTLRGANCPVLTVRTPLVAQNDTPAPLLHAGPGEVVDVSLSAGSTAQSKPLFQVDGVEVVRQVVPAGAEMPDPGADSEVIVHCLDGQVACTLSGQMRRLGRGELLLLPAREPRGVKAIDNASLLLTISRAKH